MRICHSLLGDAIQVEDQELKWRKPLDIVRQRAKDRWGVAVDDVIVLASGGAVVGPTTGSEALGSDPDVFVFLHSALDSQVVPLEGYAALPASRAVAEEEVAVNAAVAAEASRLEDFSAAAGTDPAFGALRNNIVEAQRWLAEEVRPAVSMAAHFEERLNVQRCAVQTVLDNLAMHRATCSRSMSLFMHKYERVQERFDQNLGKVEASMAALRDVPLHPVLRASGRDTLADAIPHERILQFTHHLQAERTRLAQRLEKLQKQDAQAQALCEQVVTKVQHLLQDETVETCTGSVKRHHAQVTGDVLPALKVRLPQEGAEPAAVLEEEKRSAGVLEGLARICQDLRSEQAELSARWDRKTTNFVQRLREVACVQSQVRGVERQAALLEEEINVQHGYTQQLAHLQKMPRAYQKALSEVERRHKFKAMLQTQSERARSMLARMVEDENTRRRNFIHHHGCHLPVDLVQGLGGFVPSVTLDVPEFDAQLVDLGSGGSATSSGGGGEAAATGSARLHFSGGAGGSSAAQAGRGSHPPPPTKSSSGAVSTSTSGGGGGPGLGTGDATTVQELEARNEALEAHVRQLLSELAAQKEQPEEATLPPAQCSGTAMSSQST